MPAAAVIPAPVAYIKVVAVKKLVVGFLVRRARPARLCRSVCWCVSTILPGKQLPLCGGLVLWILYFEKIRVFKAGLRL